MTLHLVRLRVDRAALDTFAVANRASDDDYGYALHLASRRRFGEAGPQPFRLFADGPGDPYVLGYASDPAALADAAAIPVTGDDDLHGVFPAAPDMRAMPEAWREGARYGFDVRVRPVVRFGGRVRAARAEREGAWMNRGGKAAQEMDAFVAACERAGTGVPVDREAVYRDWLVKRFEGIAELDRDAVRMQRGRRVRTSRSSHGKPGASRVEGPEAVMTGTLTIADPVAFAGLLARGIGRHAAFGFGMLLLSPPGRAG